MKKGLKLFACGFVAMTALASHVNAEEVTNEASLNTCIVKNGNVCSLTENIELENLVDIKYDITLDLNGYSITPKETLKHSGGLVTVVHGGKLTIKDSKENGKISTGDSGNVWGAVQLTKKGETDITKKAMLVVEDGTLEGYYYAVTGNGNPDRVNTDITINGGKLVGLKEGESLGVYHPQDGVLTVNGGEITGATGIEMRAGKLTVTGGTIRGTHKPVDVNPNGSGATTYGAGIAVAQHTTQKTIEVKVSNGVVEGHTALYESNPQNNNADAIKKVSIEVTGGTFNAINEGTNAVLSENLTKFISGGTFNSDVSDYMVESNEEAPTDTFEVKTLDGEIKYVVAEEAKVEEGYFGLGFSEEGFKEVFGEEEGFEEVSKLINEALGDKYKAAIYYELLYGDLINNNFVLGTEITDKLDEKVKVTLDIPETIEKLKEGYTRNYSVIRIHGNDDKTFESSILPATEKDGKVIFETDRFSTYVLAYEDVKIEEKTENPKTGDNMLMYFVVSFISIVGLMLTTLKITKKSK